MENRGALRFLVRTLPGQPNQWRQSVCTRYSPCRQPSGHERFPEVIMDSSLETNSWMENETVCAYRALGRFTLLARPTVSKV
jgi:hypothetical protein